ncbi:hypothetical protein Desaf_0266 [Desulfocurvibacter africanus subsp. africanus str. Walvis Bay]|uniref:Uncharacterized protein n=1 Tax=Desulfocurvibacter africanus subsp. africanus str. Walvis Bay TaxID=690850 RepID=F3YU18_DESAF|nr:hypothetical protein Desaf_0266 [Desulfocurvibacter africanus subsp. africanus str. Walvis Bay]
MLNHCTGELKRHPIATKKPPTKARATVGGQEVETPD